MAYSKMSPVTKEVAASSCDGVASLATDALISILPPSLPHFLSPPHTDCPGISAFKKALACMENSLGERATWVLTCQEAVGRKWIPSQG